MWKHRVAFAALAILSAACGEEEDPIILDGPKIEDPVAHFGLEPCTCYEFEREDGAGARIGVAVEAVSTGFVGNPDGAEEYAVVYRVSGQQDRVYVFRPTDPELLLRNVIIDIPTGPAWSSEPPIPWLTGPIAPRDQAVQASLQMTQVLDGTTHDPVDVSVRVTYTAEEVTYSLDGETTETAQATRVSHRNLPYFEPLHWFIPEVGLVGLEYDTGNGAARYVLKRKRVLEGACPSDNLGSLPGGCGVTF